MTYKYVIDSDNPEESVLDPSTLSEARVKNMTHGDYTQLQLRYYMFKYGQHIRFHTKGNSKVYNVTPTAKAFGKDALDWLKEIGDMELPVPPYRKLTDKWPVLELLGENAVLVSEHLMMIFLMWLDPVFAFEFAQCELELKVRDREGFKELEIRNQRNINTNIDFM